MIKYKVGEAGNLGVTPESVAKFLKAEWTRPIAISSPRFYDWQFRQAPDNAGKDRCIVAVDGDSQVVGFMGLNDRKFYLGGDSLQGAELTTWVVSQKARGTGCAQAMLEQLKAAYDVLVGMGISAMALPVYTRLGFRYLRYIPRYVRVFNLDSVKLISQIDHLGERLVRKYASLPTLTYRSREIELSTAAEFVGPLHSNFCCFGRDSENLKWRYSDHPVYRYQAFLVRSSGKDAVLVLRIEQKEHLTVIHVIDVFGDAAVFPSVVHFIDTFGKDNNADFADFSCTSSRIGHVFWHYGWFSMVDDYYIQVPSLFFPIELRSPPTTSLILWSKYNMCSLLDQSQLYITKGDCDLDRPTMEYLQERNGPT